MGAVFTAWSNDVSADGGVATAWPFQDQYYGMWGARYSNQQYGTLYNQGLIDTAAPQQQENNKQYIIVLAPPEVQADSPQTMTLWQKFLNAGFTWGDQAADAVGLPSLKTLGNIASGITWIGLAAAAVVLWIAIRPRE